MAQSEIVWEKVGDNQSLLQSAKNSASFETYADQAEIWETRLMTIDHILTSLSQIQRKWVAFHCIFVATSLNLYAVPFNIIEFDLR